MTSITCTECKRRTDIEDITNVEPGEVLLCPPCEVRLKRVPFELKKLALQIRADWDREMLRYAWKDHLREGKCQCEGCRLKEGKVLHHLNMKILWLRHYNDVVKKAQNPPYVSEVIPFKQQPAA